MVLDIWAEKHENNNLGYWATKPEDPIWENMTNQNLWFRLTINITLWLFNIAMENGSFIDDFPIKTSIYKGFSMAMLNNQMVSTQINKLEQHLTVKRM